MEPNHGAFGLGKEIAIKIQINIDPLFELQITLFTLQLIKNIYKYLFFISASLHCIKYFFVRGFMSNKQQ